MVTTEQVTRETLNEAVAQLIENIHESTGRLLNKSIQDIHVAVNHLLESWLQFTKQALCDPSLVNDAQITYWQDYLNLCENLHQDLAMLKKTSGTRGREMILTAFVERFYLLISQHVKQVFQHIFDMGNRDEGREMESYHRQFASAITANGFKNDSTLPSKNLLSVH